MFAVAALTITVAACSNKDKASPGQDKDKQTTDPEAPALAAKQAWCTAVFHEIWSQAESYGYLAGQGPDIDDLAKLAPTEELANAVLSVYEWRAAGYSGSAEAAEAAEAAFQALARDSLTCPDASGPGSGFITAILATEPVLETYTPATVPAVTGPIGPAAEYNLAPTALDPPDLTGATLLLTVEQDGWRLDAYQVGVIESTETSPFKWIGGRPAIRIGDPIRALTFIFTNIGSDTWASHTTPITVIANWSEESGDLANLVKPTTSEFDTTSWENFNDDIGENQPPVLAGQSYQVTVFLMAHPGEYSVETSVTTWDKKDGGSSTNTLITGNFTAG
jgi:hypothetical protein